MDLKSDLSDLSEHKILLFFKKKTETVFVTLNLIIILKNIESASYFLLELAN